MPTTNSSDIVSAERRVERRGEWEGGVNPHDWWKRAAVAKKDNFIVSWCELLYYDVQRETETSRNEMQVDLLVKTQEGVILMSVHLKKACVLNFRSRK